MAGKVSVIKKDLFRRIHFRVDDASQKKEEKRAENRITDRSSAFLFLALVVGMFLLAYPSVADYWNSFHQSRAIASYQETVDKLNREEDEKLWNEAVEWNKKLAANYTGPYTLTDSEMAEYNSILDVTGTGIMGYVTIQKIRVKLPIYHGTDEANLQVAIGHLEWSSFPVGGEDTHCVISGHRGLPSAKLFTDLDKLVEGDTFTITVLTQTITYEVDQILTVLPDDMEALKREEGKDLVTLITCTPYGINSHRLLVRGHRVENEAEDKKGSTFSGTSAEQDAGRNYDRYVPFVAGTAVLIFGALTFGPLFRKKK